MGDEDQSVRSHRWRQGLSLQKGKSDSLLVVLFSITKTPTFGNKPAEALPMSHPKENIMSASIVEQQMPRRTSSHLLQEV